MKKALSFFNSTIKKNRLAHLYMLEGPKGSGKNTLAFLVSKELLLRKGDDEERLFDQIKNLKHPNVLLVRPEGNLIKKEQILVLQNEFSKTSLVSGARIYIIDEIEKISAAAANSLLKLMEEPEGKTTYGFLLTENSSLVLQTIKSRSQIIHLQGIDKKEIKEGLLANGVPSLLSEILPEVTNNSDEALELVEHPSVLEIEDFIKSVSSDWLDLEKVFAIDYADKLPNTRSDRNWYKSFSNLLLLFFTDVIRYKVHRALTFETLRIEIQAISSKCSLQTLEMITSKLEENISRQKTFINIDLYFQKLLQDLDKERKR